MSCFACVQSAYTLLRWRMRAGSRQWLPWTHGVASLQGPDGALRLFRGPLASVHSFPRLGEAKDTNASATF